MFKPHKKIPNLWVNRARWMQVFTTSAWIRQNTHVQWLPLQRRDHFSPAKICSSNPWRVSRGQQRIMEESEGITGSTYLQMWQPRKKEKKQEAKPWRHAGNFLFWKRFCLFVILNWGREGGKKACLLYKPEKLTPHFCSSLSWSVTEGQQHFHVSCWCCFTSSLKSLERRRKNAAEPGFLKHHSGWCLYQKPRPKAVFGSHPWGSGPIVPCTVQTPTESHPLSQRTCSPNRDGRGRIAGGLEISWRAQSCTIWCSDFQPSNLLFLTASHPLPLWCLQGVNGTKDNCVWLGIFNSWEFYIQAHTRWTWLPPGTVSPPGPKRGCSDSDSKVTFTAEMPFKQRDRRRAQLWRNPAVETPSHLATQSQKTVCLKDWRLTIGRTVFVSC